MDERITVIGNVGQEPRRKTTSRGEALEFSLARNERVQGTDGTWTDGETTWYTVTAWDRLGANAAASLHKGQPVIVHGDARRTEWTGRDGTVRSRLDLRAVAIGHDLNLGIGGFTKAVGPRSAPAAEAVATETPQTAGRPLEPVPAPAPSGWEAPRATEEETPF